MLLFWMFWYTLEQYWKIFFRFYHIVKSMISLYKLNTHGHRLIVFHKLWNFGTAWCWYRQSICHYGLPSNSLFSGISPAYHVGPVDNRPSTDWLNYFVKNIYIYFTGTHDMWNVSYEMNTLYMTHTMWQMVGGKTSLKMSGSYGLGVRVFLTYFHNRPLGLSEWIH